MLGTQKMKATVITNGYSSQSYPLSKGDLILVSLFALQMETCVGSYLMLYISLR